MNLRDLRNWQAEYLNSKNIHQKIKVKDAMIKPILLHEDDEIEIIIKKLKNEENNYCIVIDENKYFLGEITIEKLISIIANTSIKEPIVKLLDVGYRRGINFTKAKDHMIKHKNFVYENNSILDVLKIIDKKKSNYIPVLNENKEVVGIVTASSLLSLLSKH